MIFGLNYWFDTYYNHISYFISLRINNKIFNCACSLDIHTVVKELRSKIFGQHPGYFKAVFLMHTRIIIVSIYKYTVYIDQAGFQKHLLTSCFRVWLVTNCLFLNKIIFLSKINHSSILFFFFGNTNTWFLLCFLWHWHHGWCSIRYTHCTGASLE
jgi:hypothetical protein